MVNADRAITNDTAIIILFIFVCFSWLMYVYAQIFSLRKPVKYESPCSLSLSSKSIIMILKVTFESGYEVFTDLGKEFHFIGRNKNPEGFEQCVKEEFTKDVHGIADECYAFVFSYGQRGKRPRSIPLYKGHENVMLNENSSVFMDFTYK